MLKSTIRKFCLSKHTRKKCTYCYWKAADTILWRSFVQSLSFPLLFPSPTEIYSSKFSPPQYTHTQKHNNRLIFWKIVFALSFCYVRIRHEQRKKGQIEAKYRETEKKQREGGESVPSGLVFSLPAGFGGRYGWSLTLWRGQARRWPAPHSASIWTQTPSPRLFLAPCRHTWNTKKTDNSEPTGQKNKQKKKTLLLMNLPQRIVSACYVVAYLMLFLIFLK